MSMEFHRSVDRHGIRRADVLHAVDHAVVVVEVGPDQDPPKVLVIGPAWSGQLLEIVVLLLDGDRVLAIHAMRMRAKFEPLLFGREGR